MDGCEGLTPEQIEILLKHTDNTWNQRRSTMTPRESQTPRKNRCLFCLELVGKNKTTRKYLVGVMRQHYNTCEDLKTFITAAWTEAKVERLAAITEADLPGCSFCKLKFHVRFKPVVKYYVN